MCRCVDPGLMEHDLFPSVYRFLTFLGGKEKKYDLGSRQTQKTSNPASIYSNSTLGKTHVVLFYDHNVLLGVIVPTMLDQGNQIHPWVFGEFLHTFSNLVGAQPPTNCSFARYLVGKMAKQLLICSSLRAQPSNTFLCVPFRRIHIQSFMGSWNRSESAFQKVYEKSNGRYIVISLKIFFSEKNKQKKQLNQFIKFPDSSSITNLELQTTIFLWMFQLDDSK